MPGLNSTRLPAGPTTGCGNARWKLAQRDPRRGRAGRHHWEGLATLTMRRIGTELGVDTDEAVYRALSATKRRVLERRWPRTGVSLTTPEL